MTATGRLQKLRIRLEAEAEPEPRAYAARYSLELADAETLDLDAALGRGIRIRFTGNRTCSGCGAPARKLYGGPYCYACFTTLARCDLCVVSPVRCHYDEGTCREPDWGEAFCFQPHCVYLANSSGPKVGITRLDRELGRWADQGATQGVVIADADTRQLAGRLEASLSVRVSDRTDWKRLVGGPARPTDLERLACQLRERAEDLPGVRWRGALDTVSITYPVRDYCPAERLRLDDEEHEARGNLQGIKGQFMLLSTGAFSVADHEGFEVSIEITDPFPQATGRQQSLF